MPLGFESQHGTLNLSWLCLFSQCSLCPFSPCPSLSQALHHSEEQPAGCQEQTHWGAVSGLQVLVLFLTSTTTRWHTHSQSDLALEIGSCASVSRVAWCSKFCSFIFGKLWACSEVFWSLNRISELWCVNLYPRSPINPQELWGLSAWELSGVLGCEWGKWLQHRFVWTHDH